MSTALEKELSELKSLVASLAGEIKALKAVSLRSSDLTAERLLQIKMIARADAMGDPRPRRLYNAQRRKELEAERHLQGSRS